MAISYTDYKKKYNENITESQNKYNELRKQQVQNSTTNKTTSTISTNNKQKQEKNNRVQELLKQRQQEISLPTYTETKPSPFNTNFKTDNNKNNMNSVNQQLSKLKNASQNEELKNLVKENAKTSLGETIGKTIGTGSALLTRGGLGALEKFHEFSLNASSNINSFLGEKLGIYTKEEAEKERKSAQELIKRSLKNEAMEKIGWDEDLWQEMEKGSLVKRDNIGGKVIEGIGEMLPTLAVGSSVGATGNLTKVQRLITSIPTSLTMGVGAYGGSLEQAYNEGATTSQANKYAFGSALVETATEWLTGGVPGLNDAGILDSLEDKTLSKVSNSLAKFLIKNSYNVIGEGTEEALSEIINPILKNATYSQGEKVDWNAVIESAIVGGITGGILDLPGNISSYNVDVNTNKLKQQQISNQATQNFIEQNNLKPTQINNNEISLPKINTNQEMNVQQNINNINTMNKTTEGLDLIESSKVYNIDSTSETIRSINNLLNKKNINGRFDSTLFNNTKTNAFWTVDSNGNRNVIFNPNANTNDLLQNVAIHELTHDLLSSKNSAEILNSNDIIDYVSKIDGYQEARQSLVKSYSEVYDINDPQFENMINEEVVASVLGNKLGNQEFVNRLTTENISLSKKIYNWIVDRINQLKNLVGYKSEKAYWNDVKNRFEKAYKMSYNNTNKQADIRMSIYSGNVKYKNKTLNSIVFAKAVSTGETNFSVRDANNYYIIDNAIDGDYDIFKVYPIEGNEEFLNNLDKLRGEYNANRNRTSNSENTTGIEDRLGFNSRNNANVEGEQSWTEFIDSVLKTVRQEKSDNKRFSIESRRNNRELDNSSFSFDNQGRKLTKQQQEYFKDSKVRDEEGRLLEVYHGTQNEFNVFEKRAGVRNIAHVKEYEVETKGFFFSTSADFASDYGWNTRNFYLNVTKPLFSPNNSYTENELADIRYIMQPLVDADVENGDLEIKKYDDGSIRYKDNYLYRHPDSVWERYASKENGVDWESIDTDAFNEVIRRMQEKGYDGTFVDELQQDGEGNNISSIFVLNPNQIKLTTNTNPTSNDDIRYSQENKNWDEFVNKNFKSEGTGKTLQEVKLPTAKNKIPTYKDFEVKEIPKNPTKESTYADFKEEKRTRKEVQAELKQEMGITVDDIQVGKDINSIDFQRTDPIRINEKVFGYEVGKKINDATINKTKHNEAERTRFLNKERNEIKELGIKARSKESAAVQKYGEKQYVNDKGELLKYGDKELAQEFTDIETQNKIKNAAKVIRGKYDTYIDEINSVIIELGYDPIPKRPDYMRHFQELDDKLSKWGIPLNPTDLNKDNIPTDINGLTDQFKPGKNWFASAMARKGLKTTYDAITGIDGYLEGASNLMYHTEDIQRYRTLSKFIRETYGQTHGLDNIENMTEEQKQQRIEDIYDNKLSKYVAWLDEQANSLAGKKGGIDRAAERLLGRKIYSVLDTAKKQVGSNMTGFNVRSALTNFASSVQGASKTNKLAFVKGTISTVQNIIHNDGLIDKSDFLTSRFGSDQLSKKLWQKASNAGQILMTGSDYFTANQIWRSKYFENLQKGMSEAEAVKHADDFASRIMGDRSKGSTAEIFNSKTLGLLTQFQLEVNNYWSTIIHDNKMDIKSGNKSGATVLFQLGQLAAMSYMFNNLMKSLAGSDVMFDSIDMLKKIIGSDDDEEKTLEERATEVFGDLWDNLPFVSFLTGGRIPMSEAFTGGTTLLNKLTGQTDSYGNEIKWEDVKDDVISSAFYWLLPTGYGQLKKTTKGVSMYNEDNPIPGSYTASGNLRFNADTSTGGKIKAALFGEYSSSEAQKYIDSGFKAISKSRLQEMEDLGMSASEYREYRSGLSDSGTTNAKKIEYIANSNYSDKQKNIMAKDLLNRDFDIKEYEKYDSYEEYDYAYKNPEKYSVIKQITSFDKYNTYKEKIDDIRANTTNDKTEIIKYINSLNLSIPQKAMFIKMYYPSFDDYNTQIVNYVKQSTKTLEERTIILNKLGFTIKNGRVYW